MTLNIPRETKWICYSAASGCTQLKTVNLPVELKGIFRNAFAYCTNLKEFFIPEYANVVEPFTEQGILFKVYSNSYGESYAKAGGYTYEIIGTHTHIWDDGSVIIEATCEDSGTCVYSCTLCGMDRYETIPLNGHSWQDWVIVQEPKCEWIGEKERTCSVCNEVETETIPALCSVSKKQYRESNIHQFKQKGGEGICKGCDQSCKKGKSKNHGKIRKEKSDLYCNSKIILI